MGIYLPTMLRLSFISYQFLAHLDNFGGPQLHNHEVINQNVRDVRDALHVSE